MMKKRVLVLIMMFTMMLVSCGQKENQEPIEAEATPSISENTDATENKELSDEKRAEVFQAYVDELPKLSGKSFNMNLGFSDANGLYAVIEGDSGTLFYEYPLINKNLCTFNYNPSDNSLNVFSLEVGENEEVTVVDSEKLNDFIELSDDSKILFAGMSLSDDRDVLMIESRGLAYTYADGVTYNITLLEIKEDGTLDIIYDDGLSGSGDEDITSSIRNSYNEAVSKTYSQEDFENAFYNGNLIIEQENYPILASIKFRSDTADLADANNWDGVNEVTSQIYEGDFVNSGKTIHWGTGSFSN